jgi:hypothetical protein
VVTPAPVLDGHPDGFHSVRIKGFETRQRAFGAPDLPSKTVLVALPPGAVPSLEVRPHDELPWAGIRPRPVPRRTLEAAIDPNLRVREDAAEHRDLASRIRRARDRIQPDAAIYDGDDPFPRRLAWLGQTGTIRDQRYVELHLAPVRYDPRLPGLRIVPELEVVVHFSGARLPGGPGAPDPRFESIYRDAFVNYEQSLLFRSPSEAALVEAEAAPTRTPKDAGTPRQRILVREHGLVRLDHARMSGTDFLLHDLSTWRLTNRGVQVPLEIQDDGDGILEPGEWVQFYGQALDDEPKTELNTDLPGTVDLYEARDFTDVNTYFLTVEAGPEPPMATRDGAPTMIRVPPDHFEHTARAEVDDAYRPLGAADPWYWLPTLFAGSADTRTDFIPLPGLYDGTLGATLRVHVQGRSETLSVDPDHHVRIALSNSSDELLAVEDGYFDNRTLYLHELNWSWSGSGPVLSGPVEVGLQAVVVSGTFNQIILDYIEVVYRRAFTVENEQLTFSWPDEDAEFLVGGLQDPNPAVYEITLAQDEKVVQPVRLTGVSVSGVAPPYSVRFRVDNDPGLADGSPRHFLVLGAGGVSIPPNPDFAPDTVSDLRDNANAADLLVIAHPDVLDLSPGSALTLLLDHRATVQGGGLTSKVVLVEDVQDEFNHGLPGPLAIREFLRWVLSTSPGEGWAVKPSHLLLLGDGSYDYKETLDTGNLVPTQMIFKNDPVLGYYASDSVMGAVMGDDWVPDLFIGRIPVRTLAEAEVVLDKIRLHEQSPPAGAWRSRALFVSDRGKTGSNPGEALQFEGINDLAESFMRLPPYSSTKLRYWTDYYCCGQVPDPTESMRAAILNEVTAGAALVQYIGHGSFVVWSDDAFFDERIAPRDSEGLFNGDQLPWLQAHNCLSGGFHFQRYGLGSNWLARDGGGSVGVFSPTGLSYNFIGQRVTEVVWEELFGPTKERLVARRASSTRCWVTRPRAWHCTRSIRRTRCRPCRATPRWS